LQGEILNLPTPQCSAESGLNSFCYGDNLYTTITHCPDNPGDGTFMSLSFTSGAVYADHTIWIYDGDNLNTEPIAGPVSDLTGLDFNAGNATGCLTIYIESDGVNTCATGAVPPIVYTLDCNNDSGYEIAWSPSTWLNDSTVLNSEVQVLEDVELDLSVYLTGAPYCEATDQVVLQPSFTMAAVQSNPTCFDPDGFIEVTLEPFAGAGPWTIELWESGSLQSSVVTPLTTWVFGGLFAGEFEVIVSDENCTRSQEFTLQAQPETTIELFSDTTICIDGTAELIGVSSLPGLTWHWSNGTTDSVQYVSPSVSTIYECYASLVPGCNTDVLSVTVGVFDSLAFQFPETINLCLGDSAYVAVTELSGGLEPYSLEWSSSAFAVDYEQTVTGQFLSPALPTTYCVDLEDACETPGVQACVDLFVPEDVDPAFEASVISGCFPLQVVFEGVASDPGSIATAEWQFGDGMTSSDVDSTSHSYGEIGFYTVTYSIVTEYGCEFEFTEDSLIRVNPWPIAEFAADPWEQMLPGNRVEFTNYSLGAIQYQWDFAGLETSSEFEPEFYFPESGGEYPVELVAINEWGCKDSVAYYIWLIDDFALYVPNAFSPDNDGQNDAWQIIGQDVDPLQYHVRVWDRWGQLVFESRDLEEVWVGDFQGGTHYVQTETFGYAIEARSLSTAAEHTICGYVTVVR
jgi:gliding motility-associated-like protein